MNEKVRKALINYFECQHEEEVYFGVTVKDILEELEKDTIQLPLPIFDGFDSDGELTGDKCMMCLYQNKKCKYQIPYGEGAFLICKNYPRCLETGCEDER